MLTRPTAWDILIVVLLVCSVNLAHVDVKYTLDQINNAKDVIIPLAWIDSIDDKTHKHEQSLTVDPVPSSPLDSVTHASLKGPSSASFKGSIRIPPALPPRRRPLSEINLDGQWRDGSSMQISSVISVTSTTNVSPLPPMLQLFHINRQQSQNNLNAFFEESEGYLYKTYSNVFMHDIRERYKNDWRWLFHIPHKLDDRLPTDDLKTSLYELLVVHIKNSNHEETVELQDYLFHDLRLILGVTIRKDKLLRALLNQDTLIPHPLLRHKFRIELLKNATLTDFSSLDEFVSWQRRQLYISNNLLLGEMPSEETVQVLNQTVNIKDMWTALSLKIASVANDEEYATTALPELEAIIDLLGTIRSPSEPNIFLLQLYTYLLPSCMDPDILWQFHHSQSNAIITGFLQNFRTFCDLPQWSHEACLVDYLYDSYLQFGQSKLLATTISLVQTMVTRYLHDTAVNVAFSFVSFLFPTFLGLKASISNYYDWPLPRTSDFPLVCTLYLSLLPAYERPTDLPYPPSLPLTSPTLLYGHQLGLILTSAKRSQYSATLREALSGASEERLKKYITIWTGQLKIDLDVFWPIAQPIMNSSVWWNAICHPSIDLMVRDLSRTIKKEQFRLSGPLINIFRELVNLESFLLSSATQFCLGKDVVMDLTLESILGPLVQAWVAEQSSQLPMMIARTVEMDNFEPVDEKVLYSSSVVDTFVFLNSYLKIFFSVPVHAVLEQWVPSICADISRCVAIYARQCIASLPVINTRMSWLKEKSDNGKEEEEELVSAGGGMRKDQSKTFGQSSGIFIFHPTNGTDIAAAILSGKQNYMRLNNLAFGEEKVKEIRERVRSQCQELNLFNMRYGGKRFVWQNLFLGSTRGLSNARSILIHHIANRLVYSDLRSIFFDTLYLPTIQQSPMIKAMTHLDMRSDIMHWAHPSLCHRVLRAYMAAVLDGYQRILFEMGNHRFYRVEDYEQIESDMDMMKELFIPSKNENPRSGLCQKDVDRAFSKLGILAQALMPIATQHLVEIYEQFINNSEGRVVVDSIPYPLTLDNLKSTICHRRDTASKVFVKRHRIKGIKIKELKAE